MLSSSDVYIALTSAKFKKTTCSWIWSVYDYYILHGKDVKNPIRWFDANDIVAVANKSDVEEIPGNYDL